MKDKFEEIKIKMVMKLRGVGRDEAIELIMSRTSAATSTRNTDRRTPGSVTKEDELLDLDDEPEMVSAEEFFGS